MITALDLFFIVLSLLVMAAGFTRRFSMWRMGRRETRPRSVKGFAAYLTGHRVILRYLSRGLMHWFLFWGTTVALAVVIASQFRPVLPEGVSTLLSFVCDLLGLAMVLAAVFILLRRIRRPKEERAPGALFPILLFLFILLSGFLAEGARLSITGSSFSWACPVGSLPAMALPASPLLMQGMIRIHFLGVLFFFALMPYTFMRHIVASSLNVVYRGGDNSGRLRPADLDQGVPGAGEVKDFSWKQLLDADACVSCGRCDDHCPAVISGKSLSPRRVMRNILTRMEEAHRSPGTGCSPSLKESISDMEIWACTACLACVEHCPVFAAPADKIMEMRRYRVMGEAALPAEARSTLRNLEIYGDVYGKGIARRTDWAFNRDVALLSGEKVLLWVGCSAAFHPRYQQAARAMVKILKAAGIPFGILGKGELCCGDPARRLGEESLYVRLAQENIDRMKRYAFQKVVTLCPHCLNTLKNEYPSLGGGFEVFHAVEFIAAMIQENRIVLNYALPPKVALHDPCYLGRGNGIYRPLREILRAVPRAELVELPRNREKSFCCGGGGGRMWLHEKEGKRINALRSEEACRAGVDIVGTACPYCLAMLEDGIKAVEAGKNVPRVMDLVEIVASSIR
ncbi:MAG: (Fe-S)-binding protein [Thermodesulfobacteriota bacterium]